jgi:putative peptidoglycan lipid II flippase
MSEAALISVSPVEPVENETTRPSHASYVSHAKLIGAVTLLSRLLGMARESCASNFFGAGAAYSAFTVAFTVPNLFRKLLGEGALSAAFIPLYAQAVKQEKAGTGGTLSANDFAAASVNLLCAILLLITLVGEAALYAATFLHLSSKNLLGVHLTMIMLPYVLLVCGTAFLSGILQVHARFAAAAATAIVLNACHIVAIIIAAHLFDLSSPAGMQRGVRWLSWSVLIAGCLQISMLLPSLRAVGFRFKPSFHIFTPAIRRMLMLTLPVALGAGVLQVSTMLDRGMSFFLASDGHRTTFTLLHQTIRYPLAPGAAARLNWAQFLYQFPLGVFAIALATAIFPKLSSDAAHEHATPGLAGRHAVPDQFKHVLRKGIEASLFIGFPASIGLIVVRLPAVQLMFQQGKFTSTDTQWVALSTAIYSAAIWAFSLQQILNRAYYALHDTVTPLIWGVMNLVVNTAIEVPLLWTRMGESGMAVGTLVSFALQSVIMLWMLDRRVGGMGLRQSARPIAIMLTASAAMLAVCTLLQHSALYPHGQHKITWAMQLVLLMAAGGLTYFGTCWVLGIDVMAHVRRRKAGVA